MTEQQTMSPEELEANNISELNRGIRDLIVHNESRMALVRDNANPWVELQFEMMSFKLDILLDVLVGSLPSPQLRMAEYGMDFQLRLSRLLDSLFPPSEAD